MSDTHTANRREDLRLITGRGRYTSDWDLPGQLHAAFLRSDHAHADIVSMNTAPALARPGVQAVFAGSDARAAGYVRFPLMSNFINRNGGAPIKSDRPVLAHGKVRFVGEVVAMVVAKSASAAQDALDAIEIEYRDLPAAATINDALAKGAQPLHAGVPDNRSFIWEAGDADAVAHAFPGAAHVARIDVVSTRVVASPMEPRAYLVSYDAASDCYDFHTQAQGMAMLRWQLAQLTGLPEEKLRLHLYDVGGSFGQRSSAYPEHAALMMASKKLGRPVKWVSTRSEGFLSDAHGRGIQMSGQLALDKDGNFLAARYDFKCDMGAYLTPTGCSGHLRNVAACMTGVYKTPALYGDFSLVHTNAAPIAAYRGAGRPDIAYVVERLVDKAAADMNIDRAELRRRNFIPMTAFPYTSMTGGVYELSDFAGCLDKALKAADWAGFARRRAAAARTGKLRGIGIGTVIEGTGLGRSPSDQIALEFDAQGKLTLCTATLSSGQSHETTFTQVVAQSLGVAHEFVGFCSSRRDNEILGNGSGGSRSMVGAGSVCQIASQKLIAQALPLAAEALEVEPSQIKFAHGVFNANEGGKSISLEALARRLAGTHPHPMNVLAESSVGSTYPNGCHIAEVEIDPETGVTQVASYFAADDCGVVINHSIVEGQVHGGVMQGAGQVFGEHAVYDRGSGQLLTGSFNDYYMPRAGLIPEIRMDEHPVPSTANVLGAKGVGESGCTASLPTLVSAVMDALRPLGVPELDMPLTPAKVWHAIQDAKAQQKVKAH
jgi:aerobic carbon-monoxide dehydrogenase large subunit